MHRFHLLILMLLAGVLVNAQGFPAIADDETATPTTAAVSKKQAEHDAFARGFANTVLAIIQDNKKSYAERKEILRNSFANSVDIDWIAKFVLGKTWNTATPDQRVRYIQLYRKFLTETYVSNFAESPDKRIRDIKIFGVNNASDEPNESDFSVRTEMMLADMESPRVTYLVHEDNGAYRVRDFAIENVSLIATHRSEFAQIAANGGIETVMSTLQERLKQPNAGEPLTSNSRPK